MHCLVSFIYMYIYIYIYEWVIESTAAYMEQSTICAAVFWWFAEIVSVGLPQEKRYNGLCPSGACQDRWADKCFSQYSLLLLFLPIASLCPCCFSFSLLLLFLFIASLSLYCFSFSLLLLFLFIASLYCWRYSPSLPELEDLFLLFCFSNLSIIGVQSFIYTCIYICHTNCATHM